MSFLTIPVKFIMQKILLKKDVHLNKNQYFFCVFYECLGYTLSTSIKAVFILIFGSLNFVLFISKILGEKIRFSASSQIPTSKKSIFGHFEVIFLNVQNLSRARVVISCENIWSDVF